MASVSSLKDRARKEEQRGNWSRAVDLYRQALRRADEQGDLMRELGLYNRIGDLQQRLGDADRAVDSYLEATEQYEAEGLQAPAVALCNKILRVAPERDEVRLRLMRLHLSSGLVADARQVLVEFVRRADAAEREEEALEALLEFVAASGDEALRLEAAERLADVGRRDEAVQELVALRQEREERGELVGEVDLRLRRLAPELVPEPAREPEPAASEPAAAEVSPEVEEPTATREELTEEMADAAPEEVREDEPEKEASREEAPPRARRRRGGRPAARSRRRKARSTAEEAEARAPRPVGEGAETTAPSPAEEEERVAAAGTPDIEAAELAARAEEPVGEPVGEPEPPAPRHRRDLPAALPPLAPVRPALVAVAPSDPTAFVPGLREGSPAGWRALAPAALELAVNGAGRPLASTEAGLAGGRQPLGPGFGVARPVEHGVIGPAHRADAAAVAMDTAALARAAAALDAGAVTAVAASAAETLDGRPAPTEPGPEERAPRPAAVAMPVLPGPGEAHGLAAEAWPADGAPLAAAAPTTSFACRPYGSPAAVGDPARTEPSAGSLARDGTVRAEAETRGAATRLDSVPVADPASVIDGTAVDGSRVQRAVPVRVVPGGADLAAGDVGATGMAEPELSLGAPVDGAGAPVRRLELLKVGRPPATVSRSVPEPEEERTSRAGVLRGLRLLRGLRRAATGGEATGGDAPEEGAPRDGGAAGDVPGLATILPAFDPVDPRPARATIEVASRFEALRGDPSRPATGALAAGRLAAPDDLVTVRAPWEEEPEVTLAASEPEADSEPEAASEPEDTETILAPAPAVTEEAAARDVAEEAETPVSEADAQLETEPEDAGFASPGEPDVTAEPEEVEAAAEPEEVEAAAEPEEVEAAAEPEEVEAAAEPEEVEAAAEPEEVEAAAEPEEVEAAAEPEEVEAAAEPEEAEAAAEPEEVEAAAEPEEVEAAAEPEAVAEPDELEGGGGTDEVESDASPPGDRLTEVLRKRWASEDGDVQDRVPESEPAPEPEPAPERATEEKASEEETAFSPAASYLEPSGERDEDFPNLTGMLENLGWLGGGEGEDDESDATDATDATAEDGFVHPSPWKASARPPSPPTPRKPVAEPNGEADEDVPNLTEMLQSMGWLSTGTDDAGPAGPAPGADSSARDRGSDSTQSER